MSKLFISLCLFFTITSHADINVTTTDNWDEIYQTILKEKNPEEVLLVFDIDKTLIHFEKECKAKGFFKQVNICETEPVEPNVPDYVNELQKMNFPTLALTARSISFNEVTSEQLFWNDYDFLNKPFSCKLNKKFTSKDHPDLKISAKKPVLLRNGVAMAGSTPKDQVLRLVLKRAKLNFSKIYFVDDNYRNTRALIKGFYNDDKTLVNFFYYTKHLTEKQIKTGSKSIKKLLKEMKDKK